MSAALIPYWGDPGVVRVDTVERPDGADDGQVLVRVEACALNHLDVLVCQGLAGDRLPLPHVAGCDIVGVVERTAPRGPAAGTRVVVDPDVGGGVIGACRWGGLAEYVVAPAANAIPLSVGDPAAAPRYAALPMAYGTAHRMLFERARLTAGETVVVLGAAGGVGVACVQLASAAGARVIACSSSDVKLARLKQLGAAEVVNPTRQALRRQVRDMTGSGAQVVVDFVGHDTWAESLRCLADGGRLVCCGATSGHQADTDLRYLFSRELTIVGSDGWTAGDLHQLLAMVDVGRLDPVVDAVVPLAQAGEALSRLHRRQVLGKMVVTPSGRVA